MITWNYRWKKIKLNNNNNNKEIELIMRKNYFKLWILFQIWENKNTH